MKKPWRDVYSNLNIFISEHPEIEIEMLNQIPASIRGDFYNVFNDFRKSFVRTQITEWLTLADELTSNYSSLEKEMTESLRLDNVIMQPSLKRFISSPVDELSSILFDPVFDLLKNRTNLNYFEDNASNIIKNNFVSFYTSIYQKWVVLLLIKQLLPSQILTVILKDLEPYEIHKSGGREEPVLPPKEAKSLHFRYENDAIFVVPDCIVKSEKLNKYISFCTYIHTPTVSAVNRSEEREWISADYIQMRGFPQVLLYIGETPEEISLIGDKDYFCQPDAIILYSPLNKLCNENILIANANKLRELLQPKLGISVVLPESLPIENTAKLKENDLQEVRIDYKNTRLDVIIDRLGNF